MSLKTPNIDHRKFRDDVITLLDKYAGHLSAEDMLALAAHLTGQIIAAQDQRKITREMAIETVVKNLEVGNAEAVASLVNKTAGSA